MDRNVHLFFNPHLSPGQPVFCNLVGNISYGSVLRANQNIGYSSWTSEEKVKVKRNQFYTDKQGKKFDMFEIKHERIKFLEENTIVFVEINFV